MRFGFKFFTNDSIEKSKKGVRRSSHKYIRVFTGNNGKDEYIYPEDMKNPFKKLLSIFAITKERIANVFRSEKIEENYGVDENTFAAHVLEYLTDKAKWDKFFSNPTVAHKNKAPVNLNKKKPGVKAEDKKVTEKKETEKKMTINRSLMRKIWGIFNPAKDQDSEAMFNSGSEVSVIPAIEKIKDFVGRKTSIDTKTKITTMKWPDGREIKVDSKGNVIYDSANSKPVEVVVDPITETNELEETKNRSDAMLGNDNAKKDIHAEDKAEYNMLVSRLAELEKEFKSNGGYSYKRTTKEQDEKRRAAQKEIGIVEQKIKDFRTRIEEENKDNPFIPEVYKDGVNAWLKRAAKGQTISNDWIHKQFGGYGGGDIPFGNGLSFDLHDSEGAENPAVNLWYQSPKSAYKNFIRLDVKDMFNENYRPRFFNVDGELFSEVWRRFEEFKERVNNSEGNTPAEKFYNMVLGEDNEYSKVMGSTIIPRYRFTKDGIKDANGKLTKLNVSLRNEGTPDEGIQVYGDGYGDDIPSIFFPQNDSDSMTDYFEHDRAWVTPDHPYYNHLKVMTLKNYLYRGRATKWAKMSEEEQKKLEKQIKDLEKTLVEPTEEELAAYRENREHKEEVKERWEEAERNAIRKENERKENERIRGVLNSVRETVGKYGRVNLTGLNKEEKITALEDKINELNIKMANEKDPEKLKDMAMYRVTLDALLIDARNEPDTKPGKTDNLENIEVRPVAELEEEIADLRRKLFTAEDEELEVLNSRIAELNEELKISREREISAEEHQNRSNAMLGNQNAYKGGPGEETARAIISNPNSVEKQNYDSAEEFLRTNNRTDEEFLDVAERRLKMNDNGFSLRIAENILSKDPENVRAKEIYDQSIAKLNNYDPVTLTRKDVDLPETSVETTPIVEYTPETQRTIEMLERQIADIDKTLRMFDNNPNPNTLRFSKQYEDQKKALEKQLENVKANGKVNNTVEEKKQALEDLEDQIGQGNGFELDKKIEEAKQDLHEAEMNEKDGEDGIVTPIPTIDPETARKINDISMSGRSGNVYQHDVNVHMKEFRDMFDVSKMNDQQKEYFQERLNSYASLVGSSYNEMASKRLAAGPSWAVAGPAKFNNARFAKRMDAERRAYETFEEKKEKFIKNTQKHLKELKYTGGAENEEEVKARVFEDYSNGHYSYNDKIENTDPYAIEKISGKIKFMENAHDVTLMYRKQCKKAGISTMNWNDPPEDVEKRKEVNREVIKLAQEKGYSIEQIKQGLNHPFPQNQTQEIARNKQRLEEMQKRKEAVEKLAEKEPENGGNAGTVGRVDFDGGYVYENLEMDRIQIIYDGKPDKDTISTLKHNGFHWTPSQGAWQRQLNRNGRMAVNRVFAETGVDKKIDIDGAGEVQKSDLKEDELFVKAFEFCDFYLGKSYNPGDLRHWKGKIFKFSDNGKWERFI